MGQSAEASAETQEDVVLSLQRKVEEIVLPMTKELTYAVLYYSDTLHDCAVGASILTNVLQQKLPDYEVRVGYGFYYTQVHHFWTEVDRRLYVDGTLLQFLDGACNPYEENEICVGRIEELLRFGIQRFDRDNPQKFKSPLPYPKTTDDLLHYPDDPFVPHFECHMKQRNGMEMERVRKTIQSLLK